MSLSSPSRLRLLLLGCSLVLTVVALQSSPAYAKGGGLGTCGPNNAIYYYSDASHTTLVGTCEPDCCDCTTCTCTGSTSAFAVNVPVNWLWCPPSS
jgi:hypothetical protein